MRWGFAIVVSAAAAAWACSLVVDTNGLADGNEPARVVEAGPDALIEASALDAGTGGDANARCADAGTDPSLVLYLTFDDDVGTTATDCSGHGHDGMVVGPGADTRVAGHFGKGLALDGNDSCIGLGRPNDLVLRGPFTVAAWAQIDDYQTPPPSSDSRAIFSNTTSPQALGWRFVTLGTAENTSVGYKIGTDAGSFTLLTPGPQPVSKWIHVAGVWIPGTRADIYVGGVLLKTSTSIPPILEDMTASVFVGCIKPGLQTFKGSLDEVRIYAKELTASEIAALAK
jgi:hypothetical protein